MVLLGAGGAVTVAHTKNMFQSSGSFSVESSTVLATLSGNPATTDPGVGGLSPQSTPAEVTSDRINAALHTDEFVSSIADDAKLNQALQSGQIGLGTIRSMIKASHTGSNLVTVRAESPYPELANDLATATISSYLESLVETATSQSTAAATFFSDEIAQDQAALDKAKQALNSYVAAHPVPAAGVRPDTEKIQIDQLDQAITQAQDQYKSAVTKRQDAELTTSQARADILQQLHVVDVPRTATSPEPKLAAALFSLTTFLGLGVIMTLVALVVSTALDRSLHGAGEVEAKLPVRVLSVVPDAKAPGPRARHHYPGGAAVQARGPSAASGVPLPSPPSGGRRPERSRSIPTGVRPA
jgi:hypothetical protein